MQTYKWTPRTDAPAWRVTADAALWRAVCQQVRWAEGNADVCLAAACDRDLAYYTIALADTWACVAHAREFVRHMSDPELRTIARRLLRVTAKYLRVKLPGCNND